LIGRTTEKKERVSLTDKFFNWMVFIYETQYENVSKHKGNEDSHPTDRTIGQEAHTHTEVEGGKKVSLEMEK
jgi:hypothetical protein